MAHSSPMGSGKRLTGVGKAKPKLSVPAVARHQAAP
jgi:hypothetical protein